MSRNEEGLPFQTKIRPEWADYNGHFNVAYYTLVFDMAALDFVERRLKYTLGDSSLSVTVSDIEYLREIKVGRQVRVDTIVLAADETVIHLLQVLRETEEGYIAAVEERMACLRDGPDGNVRTLPCDLHAMALNSTTVNRDGAVPAGRPKLSLDSIR